MATIRAFQQSVAKNKYRPATIRFRLNHGSRTQVMYSSDLKIAPAYWSNETQSIRPKIAYDEAERYEFNQKVLTIKSIIMEWFQKEKGGGQLTSANLKLYMDSLSRSNIQETSDTEDIAIDTYYLKYIERSTFSPNRQKQHMVVMRDLKRYQSYRNRNIRSNDPFLTVQSFDASAAKDFRFFIENEHLIQVQYPELYREGPSIEKRGKNTILAKLSALRAFINWARKEGLTTHQPFQGMQLDDTTYGDPFLLTIEEMARIKNTRLHRHPKLEYYRDVFLFQSAVGCRLSDLKAFSGVNVQQLGDSYIVEYIAEKTHRSNPKVLRVPLNETAVRIFEERFRHTNVRQPLVKFCDQTYNKALKKIFLAARITRYFNDLDPKTGQIVQARICDRASSHMARRNFIGQMFEVFNDQNLVAELSGHAYNSKQFIRYRKVTDKLRQKMVAESLKW